MYLKYILKQFNKNDNDNHKANILTIAIACLVVKSTSI